MSGRRGISRPDITEEMRQDACRKIIECEVTKKGVAARLDVDNETVSRWVRRYCADRGAKLTRRRHKCPQCKTLAQHYDVGDGKAKCLKCGHVFDPLSKEYMRCLSRAYDMAHREDRKESARRYREEHADEIRKKALAYYYAHKDEINYKRNKRKLEALKLKRNCV